MNCFFSFKNLVVSLKNAIFAKIIDYCIMTKRILTIAFTMALSCLVPVTANAAPAYLAGVMEVAVDQDVTITYSDGVLSVTGAEGQILEIVSLTGKKIMDVKVESPAQKIELNIPKGCYIVKVGKVVRKVSIR